jgi:uncharacterized membrane protein YbhN (UPF0104 family)
VPRTFSASRGQPRFRRGSDIVLLVPAAVALGAVVAVYPPSRLERSLGSLLDSVPGWLDPVWELLYAAFALWAIVLVLAALIGRRYGVALQAIASVVAAGVVAFVTARLATGHWPELDDMLLLRVDGATFPVVRVAVAAATVLAIAPHVVRPLQRLGRWVLVLGLVGAIFVEVAPPSASLASFLVAVIAASVVRLAFGTSAGQPESADVLAALAQLDLPMARLEPVARQPAGVFVARGEDATGRALLVKVYGRDAYDTQLLAKLGRALWYRDEGPRIRLSRLAAVETEALVTLVAHQAGVPAAEVILAAESLHGDALLVLHDSSRPLPGDIEDTHLASAWQTMEALRGARIAHLRIGPDTLAGFGDRIGLVDFDHAQLAPDPERYLTDRAQLLATTAALVGPERAIAAAVQALGAGGVTAVLPFLQPATLGGPLRAALDETALTVDDIRAQAAKAVGVEEPQLVRVRRVTWWTLVQFALLVFAVSAVLGALSGLDYEELGAILEEASWGWIAAGIVLAQLPRFTQALSTLGSVTASLPFVPVYAMQLATSYLNLALPSNLARMAINVRFFQRQGIPPTTAVTAGVVDSFASTVIQAVLLVVLVLSSASTLTLDLDLPSGPPVRALVALAVLVLLGVVALALVRRVRRALADRVRRWWPDVRDALRGIRAAHKLALLLGGGLATEILFAAALGLFANALGYDIGLADLLVINISVSLLASFLPVPGGIGVAEFGLTVGLVAAGMPEEPALAAALLYRGATFYLPPVWGFFSMRWLQRNELL